MEEGRHQVQEEGTPQGGSISPLLANCYLHYALDLWADQWRKRQAKGDVIIVRYADDFVIGFEHESDARGFLEELRERFRKFNLELHAGKTRVIEFGRALWTHNALTDAARRGARYAVVHKQIEIADVKNVVVYGDPAGGTKPVVENLTTDNVQVN